MYKESYFRASSIADEILSGTYERPSIKVDKPKGIISRPNREEPETYEGYDPEDDLMMQYFLSVRKQNQELAKALRSQGEGSGVAFTGEGGFAPFTPVVGDVGRAREALASVESGGRYDAVGPVVQEGAYKGQRAIGRYQVMEGNVGPWTEEILGRRYSVEEFMNDKEAQDKLAEARLQESYDSHGTWEDAASVWFSGKPVKGNISDDGYHTVPQYVSKFQAAFRRT